MGESDPECPIASPLHVRARDCRVLADRIDEDPRALPARVVERKESVKHGFGQTTPHVQNSIP